MHPRLPARDNPVRKWEQSRKKGTRSPERWQIPVPYWVPPDLENHLVRNFLVIKSQPDTDYHSLRYWPVDWLLRDQIIYLPGQPWGCPAPLSSSGAPCFRFELQVPGHKAEVREECGCRMLKGFLKFPLMKGPRKKHPWGGDTIMGGWHKSTI